MEKNTTDHYAKTAEIMKQGLPTPDERWDKEEFGPQFPKNGLLSLTENQFIARYQPEENGQGGYYRQREWSTDEEALAQAVQEGRCWTAVDDDNGEFCIVHGNHLVNRLFYIITAIPIEDPEWLVQVQDPDDGPRILCDVDWDFDDGEPTAPARVPKRVVVRLRDVDPEMEDVTEENSSQIADYLSDVYGWCVNSFDYVTLQPGEEAKL